MGRSMTDDVVGTIRSIVSAELDIPPTQLPAGADLRELPGVESLKILRIVARLERTFDVELEDDVVFRVRSITELAQSIEALRESRSP